MYYIVKGIYCAPKFQIYFIFVSMGLVIGIALFYTMYIWLPWFEKPSGPKQISEYEKKILKDIEFISELQKRKAGTVIEEVVVPKSTPCTTIPDIETDNEYRMNIAKDPTDTRWFISDKHELPEPSAAEYKIIAALSKYDIQWAREISFRGLHFTTYSHPRFDFYLPRYRVVIEYDGGLYHNTPESKKNDRSKDKFCNDNGIRVIRYGKKHYYHLHSHIESLMKELGVKKNPIR